MTKPKIVWKKTYMDRPEASDLREWSKLYGEVQKRDLSLYFDSFFTS